ncbi:hypothetical protein AGLY_009317, partial [Aphis glycines]
MNRYYGQLAAVMSHSTTTHIDMDNHKPLLLSQCLWFVLLGRSYTRCIAAFQITHKNISIDLTFNNIVDSVIVKFTNFVFELTQKGVSIMSEIEYSILGAILVVSCTQLPLCRLGYVLDITTACFLLTCLLNYDKKLNDCEQASSKHTVPLLGKSKDKITNEMLKQQNTLRVEITTGNRAMMDTWILKLFIKMENELIMSTIWRCTNKNCRAFLRIDAEDKIKVNASNLIHNHDNIEVNILNCQKFSNSLKRKAITDVSERPSKLFHTQLKKENVPTLTLTDVTYIKIICIMNDEPVHSCLASDYILNNEIGKYLTLTFGLSFLEPHEVGDFISFEIENSIFPPELWAEKSCSSQRTTNACECFHSKFKKCFDSPHPNGYKFKEALKNMQIDTTVLIRSSLEKQQVPKKAIRQRILFITRVHNLNLSGQRRAYAIDKHYHRQLQLQLNRRQPLSARTIYNQPPPGPRQISSPLRIQSGKRV